METTVKFVQGDEIDFVNGPDTQFPSVLYKYRKWNNPFHQDILKENYLYFPSPKDYQKGDPYDCNLNRRYPTDEEAIEFYKKELKEKNPNIRPFILELRAAKLLKKAPYKNPKQRIQLEKKFKRDYNNKVGVYCLCTEPNEPKMWKSYSQNSTGICIGFDTQKLIETVRNGGLVVCCDELPEVRYIVDDFVTQVYANIYSKDKDKWSHEKEFRIPKIFTRDATEKDRKISLPKDCIVEIILGCNISEEHEKEVGEIAKEKHPNAKITKQEKQDEK